MRRSLLFFLEKKDAIEWAVTQNYWDIRLIEEEVFMKKKVLIILMISIVFGFATGYSLHHLIHFNQKQEEMVLLPEHPFYLLDEVNEEVLYNTLKHYDFPNPAIITAQAVLESGNFKSKLCKDNNNLFGLYNSRTMSYFKFDSWISCVFAYKQFILSKYNPEEDYYKFLDRIGYAEDSLYESKVKELELDILNKYGSSN
jgi:hypothetical protein